MELGKIALPEAERFLYISLSLLARSTPVQLVIASRTILKIALSIGKDSIKDVTIIYQKRGYKSTIQYDSRGLVTHQHDIPLSPLSFINTRLRSKFA